MKNIRFNTLLNDVSPKKEVSFYVVLETLFNTFKEINKTELSHSVNPIHVDELNFEDWFSVN